MKAALSIVFSSIVAVCMIFGGMALRASPQRLNPIACYEENGCTRVETHLSAEVVLERLGAKCSRTEEVEGMKIYYGYSDFVNGYEVVRGYRVNVMIAEREEMTIVGMPLIGGSY